MTQQSSNMFFPMYAQPGSVSFSWVDWNVRISQLIARAWVDSEFKKKFLAAPKEVLASFGLQFPEITTVTVKEGASSYSIETAPDGQLIAYVIPLPSKPNANELLETWASGEPASPGAALLAAVLEAGNAARSGEALLSGQNATLLGSHNAALLGAQNPAANHALLANANATLLANNSDNARLLSEEATRRPASGLLAGNSGNTPGGPRVASALLGEQNESAQAEEEKPKRTRSTTKKKK